MIGRPAISEACRGPEVPQDANEGLTLFAKKPANILWRLAQGVLDDILVTSLALGAAWSIGLLPGLDQVAAIPTSLDSLASGVRSVLSLTARVGGVMALYAGIKFAYFFLFVAWKGKTPACFVLRLRVVAANGRPVSPAGSLKRAFAGGVMSHTPVIGWFLRGIDYLTALFDRRNRAVRDIAAGTMLVHDGIHVEQTVSSRSTRMMNDVDVGRRNHG